MGFASAQPILRAYGAAQHPGHAPQPENQGYALSSRSRARPSQKAGLFALRHLTGCSMLRISLDTKAGITPEEEELNEATRLYQGHRSRRGRRCSHGGAGDRGIEPGGQAAPGAGRAEIAANAES